MGFLTAPNSLARHVWRVGDLIVQRKPPVVEPPLTLSQPVAPAAVTTSRKKGKRI